MKTVVAMLVTFTVLFGVTLSLQAETTSTEKLAKETLQHVSQGSAAYLKRDYKQAIHLYSQALELEKREPTLEKNIWRVVV
ncbi:MAG: hypothetical protein E6K63_13130, partial [Nitrospirae bacterium]